MPGEGHMGKVGYEKEAVVTSNGKRQITWIVCCLAVGGFPRVTCADDPPIQIESIAQLQSLTNVSDSHLVMTPDVYTIDAAGVAAGQYGNPFMWIRGRNNTWDFTGVTFEVSTDFYRAFGSSSVQVLWVVGTNNCVKGLTVKDVGDVHDGPRKDAQLIKVHGIDNTLDSCTIMARGSTPYGYGDMMGKGTGNLTATHKKSSLQIGGERITILNCSVISRAFGHGIFLQGAIDTVIQGTYVEGELRKTSDILAETSGPAFDAGFVNIYDQPNRIQPGWTLSCQEDGIRAYTSGTPHGLGARQTRNVRVIDCTIIGMRSGVSINYAKGTKHIEGCLVLDIGTTGYRPGGKSKIVNCSGNAPHGALLDLTGTGGASVKNVTADVTLLPHDQSGNNRLVAYIGGPNHNITINNGGLGMPYTDQTILVGGARPTWRHPAGEAINSANNMTLNNYTGYPVALESTAGNCRVNSLGPVEDLGWGNATGSLPGTTVTASSHVGTNVPEHTIDGDLASLDNFWATREGIGAWIDYALAQETTIGSIAILWQDGLLYTYDFEVLVSQNGVAWTTVYSGSSRQTGSMEPYEFEPIEGRHVRLINNGSTHADNYIQIKELTCNFFPGSQTPHANVGDDVATRN